MNEPFSDELISAFLDGELTADEQSLVEQTLMDSVEHRQVFEELRALRGSLQALPTHKLPGDFSQRVLRRAERAMLREAPPEVAAPTDAGSIQGPTAASDKSEAAGFAVAPITTASPSISTPVQLRIAVLAFAALAAALLVAIYLPKVEFTPVAIRGEQEVIKPAPPGENAERIALREFAKTRMGPVQPRDTREVIVNEKEGLQKEEQLARNRANSGISEGGKRDGFGKGAAGIENAVPEVAADELKFAKKQVAGAAPLVGAPADAKPVADLKPAAADRQVDRLTTYKELRESIESDLVVIPVNCTRQALESGAVDQVLLKHNIRFDDALAAVNSSKYATQKARTEKLGLEKDSRERDSSDEYALALKRQRQLSEQASAAGVDVVVVEATVAQIDGILADFQARPDQFLGVAVQPLLEDAERSALLAQSYRATKSLEDSGEEAKLPSGGSGGARSFADAKETSPPAGPGGASPGAGGPGATGSGAAFDKVSGGKGPRGAPGGGAKGSGSPAGDIRGFGATPSAPGVPPAPAPAALAPAQVAGKPGLAKDDNDSAEFRKVEEAKRAAVKIRGEADEQAEGARRKADRFAESKFAESESGDAPSAGRANRLAPAPFNQFHRLRGAIEPQAARAPAEENPAGEAPADKAKNEEFDRSGDLGNEREHAAKKSEEGAEVQRRPGVAKLADDKTLRSEAPGKKPLGGEQPKADSAGENSLDESTARSLERLKNVVPLASGRERVRVVFVIKAVEQDAPAAKPE